MRKDKRAKGEEEEEREDRWVISYADFITLLFAFFATMYAISHVDQGKLQRFSGSMKSAFSRMGVTPADIDMRDGFALPDAETIRLEKMMRSRLEKSAILSGITLLRNDQGVAISVEDSLFFESATATIRNEALPFLGELAAVINETTNPIVIEGHTDAMPIRSSRYTSNWELSAARATSVLAVLSDSFGVRPERMSASGYGEYRPVAANTTAEGRAKNRRVNIIFVRPGERTRDEGP